MANYDDERNGYYEDDERNGAWDDDGYRNKRRKQNRAVTVYVPPAPWTTQDGAPVPVVVQAPAPVQVREKRSDGILGDVGLGALVQMAALGYAALAPLPPKPAVLGDTHADQQNLLTYQEALAQHAKRAQQITTAGFVAGMLLNGRKA